MRRSLILLAALLCLATPAGAYRAGQTVAFHVIVPNLSGVATTPSVLKAYVYNGTACIDSSKTLSAGIAALPLAGSKTAKVYGWSWTVPTSYASVSAWLHVVCRAVTSDIAQDWISPIPSTVPVNAATVDTLAAYAIQDLWQTVTSTTSATITPGDAYGSSAVTSSGSPVVNARVYLQSANTPSTHYTVGYDTSDTDGEFNIVVPINPAAADTFWIWATKDRVWQKQGQRVIVP